MSAEKDSGDKKSGFSGRKLAAGLAAVGALVGGVKGAEASVDHAANAKVAAEARQNAEGVASDTETALQNAGSTVQIHKGEVAIYDADSHAPANFFTSPSQDGEKVDVHNIVADEKHQLVMVNPVVVSGADGAYYATRLNTSENSPLVYTRVDDDSNGDSGQFRVGGSGLGGENQFSVEPATVLEPVEIPATKPGDFHNKYQVRLEDGSVVVVANGFQQRAG